MINATMNEMRWNWGQAHRDSPTVPVFNIRIDGYVRRFERETVEKILACWKSGGQLYIQDIKGRTVETSRGWFMIYTKEPNAFVNTDHHNYRDGDNPPSFEVSLHEFDTRNIENSMKRWLELTASEEHANE